MKLLDRILARRDEEDWKRRGNSARRYNEKLSSAIELLLEFDDKIVDDIYDVKSSFEKAGTPCVLIHSAYKDFMALVDPDGNLLASSVDEAK